MGYYIRVLGLHKAQPRFDHLRDALREAKSDAVLEIEAGTETAWQQLILTHAHGPDIAMIECNPVIEGELGRAELDEFIGEVRHYKPISSARWLETYLPSVQIIYAFQLLSGTDVSGGWDAVHTLQSAIWKTAGGILQSQGEGFSNEEGHYILWQFGDGAHGKWDMAVLDGDVWIPFEMDLGNAEQREAFLAGKVPRGARRL